MGFDGLKKKESKDTVVIIPPRSGKTLMMEKMAAELSEQDPKPTIGLEIIFSHNSLSSQDDLESLYDDIEFALACSGITDYKITPLVKESD